MKLSGKTALVTGAGQGIGQSIAIRLAEEGADVAINYPREQDLKGAESTRDAVVKTGRRAALVLGDVSKPSDTQRMVAQTVEQLGGLDILVNNAGIERHAAFVDIT